VREPRASSPGPERIRLWPGGWSRRTRLAAAAVTTNRRVGTTSSSAGTTRSRAADCARFPCAASPAPPRGGCARTTDGGRRLVSTLLQCGLDVNREFSPAARK
jgi:hypothetical protein